MRRSRGVCAVVATLCAGLAGCLDARAPRCGNGGVCAPGTVCIEELDVCADSSQLAACRGVTDGLPCSTETIAAGTCSHAACVARACGNGVLDPGEVCDDGNTVSGDGCSSDCQSDEACGNGIVDPEEQCDCGSAAAPNPTCSAPNSETGGECSTLCRLRCGDGAIEADEGCDPSASATVSCAGVVSNGVPFERGLTTCSDTCQPVVTVGTCKYLGWRTRLTQPPQSVVEAVPTTSIDAGFYISGDNVGTIEAYAGSAAYLGSAALAGLWASGDGTVAFAVGSAGTIVHFDGSAYSASAPFPTVDLRDVWGRSADDVYAIGADTVLHWDGAAWTAMSPPAGLASGELRAVAGDDGDDRIYVVGDAGTLLTHDATSGWQAAAVTGEDLAGVWSASGFVVAVGANGTILQGDGTSWAPGRTTATADLLSVWGDGLPGGPVKDEGFFAVGARGTVLFYDGRVWRPLELGRGVIGSPEQTLTEVRGVPTAGVGIRGDDDVITYEGAAWSPTSAPTTSAILGLWASAPDDVFAVGRGGAILHHDGLGWSSQGSPTTADLFAVWGVGSDDIYAVGDDETLVHYDGASWQPLATGLVPDGTAFRAVFAASSAGGDFVLVGGDDGVFRYDVAAGVLVPSDAEVTRALWGTSPTNVWAGGAGIQMFDGHAWSAPQPGANVAALAGTTSGAMDLYAVGADVEQLHGGVWTDGPFTESRLDAVATTAAGDVFAVGAFGTLAHASPAGLEPFVGRTTADLDALVVTGSVVVMAGDDGALDILVFHD